HRPVQRGELAQRRLELLPLRDVGRDQPVQPVRQPVPGYGTVGQRLVGERLIGALGDPRRMGTPPARATRGTPPPGTPPSAGGPVGGWSGPTGRSTLRSRARTAPLVSIWSSCSSGRLAGKVLPFTAGE